MLKIVLRGEKEDIRYWRDEQYDTYEVNHGLFIIRRGKQWVGMYAMTDVKYVEADKVVRKEDTERKEKK